MHTCVTEGVFDGKISWPHDGFISLRREDLVHKARLLQHQYYDGKVGGHVFVR